MKKIFAPLSISDIAINYNGCNKIFWGFIDMLIGWIIVAVVILLIIYGISTATGLDFELSFLVLGAAVGALVGTFFIIKKIYKKFEEIFLKEEQIFLNTQIGIGSIEYAIGQDFEKVVLGANRLYIRTKVLDLGTIFECKDIQNFKMDYVVNNEIVHYEDPYGAAKMGAVAGVASWFGIGTIADLDSLGKDVIEKRLKIFIKFSYRGQAFNFCVFNDIIKDESAFSKVKEIMRFVKDLKKSINNKTVSTQYLTQDSLQFQKQIIREKQRLIQIFIVFGAAIFTEISALLFKIYVDNSELLIVTRIFYYLQLIVPSCLIVIETIGLIRLKKILKKFEFALIITCFLFNFIQTIIGLICIGLCVFNYAYMAVILNLPFTILYFVYLIKEKKLSDNTELTNLQQNVNLVVNNIIACCAALLTIISLSLPIINSINGFDYLSFQVHWGYDWAHIVIGIIALCQLLVSIILNVVNIIMILLPKKKNANKIANISIITCLTLNIIYMLVGIISIIISGEGFYTFSYFGLIINAFVSIPYFVFKRNKK